MGNQDGGSNKQSSKRDGYNEGNDRSEKNSLEVWCICRIVKPCTCEKRREEHRDITPTPKGDETGPGGDESDRSTPTAEDFCEENRSSEECNSCMNSKGSNEKVENDIRKKKELNRSVNDSVSFEDKIKEEIIGDLDDCVTKLGTLANAELLKRKLANLNLEKGAEYKLIDNERENDREKKILRESKDTEKGLDRATEVDMDSAKLDSVSLTSFDHMDFDASFCSLRSTGNDILMLRPDFLLVDLQTLLL